MSMLNSQPSDYVPDLYLVENSVRREGDICVYQAVDHSIKEH